MSNGIIIVLLIFVIPLILIVITLNIIQSVTKKKYKKEIDSLEYEKNVIDSAPIPPELAKIEAFLKNEKMEILYNGWKSRLEDIKSNQVPKLTDMILDTEYSLSKQDYKNTNYKLAKLEMEVYRVRTNSNFLLNEIKEITTSDEKNRAIITNLKTKYRELYETFTSRTDEFGEIGKSVSMQFESIAHRFEDFEASMEKNEYTEVTQIIKAIDEMIKHMEFVIDEIPSIILMTTKVLPKKIEEINSLYHSMLKEGYQLDYLNVEYNIDEANKKIEDVESKSKVLNLEDSTFELKVLNDYLDSLFNDFEKERTSRDTYEGIRVNFDKKLDYANKVIDDIFNRIEEIKVHYNLGAEDVDTLEQIRSEIDELNNDYKALLIHTSNNAFAYSKLINEIELLSNRLSNIENKIDNTFDKIAHVKEDEARAREQSEEIELILNKARKEIYSYHLPIIPKFYFTELSEAVMALKEVKKELETKPIDIEVLNTRVDTARDLVLKTLAHTKEVIKQARVSEMAIVYGNRYRSSYDELDKTMAYSEALFYGGEYQKSLDLTVSFLKRIEPNIMDKLNSYLSN